MSFPPGTRLSTYEITATLGAGGMGEVYRARDTVLNRDVAIKVLPESVADDAERLLRFQREAEALAALNHPNIAQVYGLERSGGTPAIVMELVEGHTLEEATRAKFEARPREPEVLEWALPIARQIAEALEAAHETGIVHRDLKPANIVVRDDGTVKVLDFGLAKALVPEPGAAADSSDSPTLTVGATQGGVILGTAAYMAPEQARGRPLTRRADIWAFGCVLYEMLTGTRAFDEEDVSETLAAVLKGQVDWSRLPSRMPPTLRSFLMRCLERDPRQRIGDMQDVRLAIEGAFDTGGEPGADAGRTRPMWRRVLPAVGFALGAAFAWVATTGPTPPEAVEATRLSMHLPHLGYDQYTPLAVSPDGRTVVYTGSDRLYRRDLAQQEPQAIAGTEGGSQPFFDPEGREVGFVDRTGSLERVPLGGGSPVTIATPGFVQGADWGPDGQILVGVVFRGLHRVSADGGTPAPVTRLNADELMHLEPDLLPGGGAVLFRTRAARSRHIAVAALDTGEHRQLIEGYSPRYLPSGHLVFLRDAALWAVPFDLDRRAVRGEPARVLEDVQDFAVDGSTGTLAYLRRSDVETELRWFDRAGAPLGVEGRIDGRFYTFGLSHDDRKLAYGADGQGIRVYDIERDVSTPLSSFGSDPNWSSDDSRIAFSEGLRGRVSSVSSLGGEQTVLYQRADGPAFLSDWSQDGDRLAIHYRSEQGPRGVVVSLSGDPEPVVFDEADVDQAQFSPDGSWIAYNADRGTGVEVWVVPFPPTAPPQQISSGGGAQPEWSPTGEELFYLSLSGMLMSVPMEKTPTGGLRPGRATPLFQTGIAVGSEVEQYAVSHTGDRILIPTRVSASSEATIVLNWYEELKRLVPGR